MDRGDKPEKSAEERLAKLLKAWNKAPDEARQAFLTAIAGDIAPLPEPIADGRYLTQSGIARIEAALKQRRMRPEQAMAEMGFGPRDKALSRALAMGYGLRLSVISALTAWLDKQD
ncbi:hypothetical protein [Rhizobium sp. TRM95796]|uniref:hypothetical protein n=1 Tax=Rhizobium sp. TRM95796 TaxID=2979862 RepID=UPI0021E6FB70|nr:hypothetical protein [Rhizobium sp. TRM95796]MCV3766513.1 hypothetical protein [Rhizobium sp. TRM95796]